MVRRRLLVIVRAGKHASNPRDAVPFADWAGLEIMIFAGIFQEEAKKCQNLRRFVAL
jgi:hypothetical protein